MVEDSCLRAAFLCTTADLKFWVQGLFIYNGKDVRGLQKHGNGIATISQAAYTGNIERIDRMQKTCNTKKSPFSETTLRRLRSLNLSLSRVAWLFN